MNEVIIKAHGKEYRIFIQAVTYTEVIIGFKIIGFEQVTLEDIQQLKLESLLQETRT